MPLFGMIMCFCFKMTRDMHLPMCFLLCDIPLDKTACCCPQNRLVSIEERGVVVLQGVARGDVTQEGVAGVRVL